jgi:hypothetical protein
MEYFIGFCVYGFNIPHLVGVSDTRHAGHDTENVVVDGIDTDLGGGSSRDSRRRKDKLENGIVDSGEVAASTWLVLLRAESERVDVDSGIWGTGMVLPRLNDVEVGPFTLGESVLTIELEFGSDHWVLSPAVHVEGSLGENKGSGV